MDSYLKGESRRDSEHEQGLSYWKKDDNLNASRPRININEPQIGTEIALPGERKFLYGNLHGRKRRHDLHRTRNVGQAEARYRGAARTGQIVHAFRIDL